MTSASFDERFAFEYGLHEAIIINKVSVYFSVDSLQGKPREIENEIFDEEFYQLLFPYIDKKSVSIAIKNLVDFGFFKTQITKKYNREVVEYIHERESRSKEKVTKKAKKS